MLTPRLEDYIQQGKDFQILLSQIQDKTVSQSYLFTGNRGLGKRTFARLAGKALLCTGDGKRPCGTCPSCVMAESRNHPDLIIIEQGKPIAADVKKDRATIPVDDIREMIRLCSVQTTDGNLRIVLIYDADKMTVQAQNCLLKTLEEPPEQTCIILVTEHMEAILSTIISRCRIIRFKPWKEEFILQILAKEGTPAEQAHDIARVCNGSIGKALDLAGNNEYWELRDEVVKAFFRNTKYSEILKYSNQWKDRKGEAEQIFQILEFHVREMLDIRLQGRNDQGIEQFPAHWQRFIRGGDIRKMLALLDAIADARKQIKFSTNFQAVAEKLLFLFTGEGNAWL